MNKRRKPIVKITSLLVVLAFVLNLIPVGFAMGADSTSRSSDRATVAVKVTLDGAPAQGVTVTLLGMHLAVKGENVSDANGIATFTDIPAGSEYYFTVNGTSTHSYYSGKLCEEFFSVPLAGNAPEVTLTSGRTVEAKVVSKWPTSSRNRGCY